MESLTIFQARTWAKLFLLNCFPGVGVECDGRDGEGAEIDEGRDPAVEGGGVVAGLEVGQ